MHTCPTCGKTYETSRSYAGHRASHSEKHAFRVMARTAKKTFEDLITDRGRKYALIRERGRRCEVCNNDTWMGQEIPIELDHISGIHSDHRKENLRLICPNCHAQTDTYKAKNIGKNSGTKRQRVLLKHPIAKYRT